MTNTGAKQTIEAFLDINRVSNFDPHALLRQADETDGKRMCLPVTAQIAWFRSKYPHGKIAVESGMDGGVIISKAKVYLDYKDSVEEFLAEGTVARAVQNMDENIRESCETSAISMVLRNAGFFIPGYEISSERTNFCEENSPSALVADNGEGAAHGERLKPKKERKTNAKKSARTQATIDENFTQDNALTEKPEGSILAEETDRMGTTHEEEFLDPEQALITQAMETLCPISKHKEKSLYEVLLTDPDSIRYIANKPERYPEVNMLCVKLCAMAQKQIA